MGAAILFPKFLRATIHLTSEVSIYYTGGIDGAKPWAPPSCFRRFSVSYNKFDVKVWIY